MVAWKSEGASVAVWVEKAFRKTLEAAHVPVIPFSQFPGFSASVLELGCPCQRAVDNDSNSFTHDLHAAVQLLIPLDPSQVPTFRLHTSTPLEERTPFLLPDLPSD